jgi:hypothetical protein
MLAENALYPLKALLRKNLFQPRFLIHLHFLFHAARKLISFFSKIVQLYQIAR